MSLAVNVLGFDGNPVDQRSFQVVPRFIKAKYQLKIQAGSYVTGGIAVDFTNGGGTPSVPNAFPPAAAGLAQGPSDVRVSATGPSGGVMADGGNYVLIPGTLPTNWLLKIFATAGTEYAAGALGNDALTDTIFVEADWPR